MSGFKLQRADKSIAIDSNYNNLGLRASGSVTTVAGDPATPGIRKASITVLSDQGILAFRSLKPAGIVYATRNGASVTYNIIGSSNDSTDFEISWWSFDLAKYAQRYISEGKMLVRRAADNEIMFDSRNKYLKVMDFFNPNVSSTADVTRSYGKLPAIVQVNRLWGWVRQVMNPQQIVEQLFTSMAWCSGSSVTLGQRNQSYSLSRWDGTDPGVLWSYGGGNSQVMIVDVESY